MPFAKKLVVAICLLALARPLAAEDKSRWSSILADFFLGPETREEFRWNGAVARGAVLEIKGVNGSVRAEPTTDKEASVLATKRGRRSAPREVQIRVVEHAGGVTVCAVYPSHGFQANECRPGSAGRMNVRNNDVAVEFTVRVPEGVSFAGRTVNGSVEASRLTADAEAHTINGSVRITTAGLGRADTVNGSITATLGRTDWKDAASFRTVNGSIALSLPAQAGAVLHAETVNGRISSDFELTSKVKATRRELSGTIGNGGRPLELETVNGSIHLRQTP